MRAVLLRSLLLLSVVAGCSERHPVSIAMQPVPPPVPIQRTLIETPPPSMIPVPPLPVLKPGTEYSLAESEALANQASPKAPLEPQFTAVKGQWDGRRCTWPTGLPPAWRRCR